MALWLVRLSVCAVLLAGMLAGQPPANFEQSVQAAMGPSLAQQRVAAAKQASAAGAIRNGPPNSFFTTAFLPAAQGAADCSPLPAGQLEALAGRAAQKTGVDAPLVRAVIDQESGGRPCAVSGRGAEGLMQLMPATAEEYGVDDVFDPLQNVEAGSKLLKSLLDRYENDPARALGAYNAGPARVDEAGGLPLIPETLDYVNAILAKLGSRAKSSAGDAGGRVPPSAAGSMQNSGWPTEPSFNDFQLFKNF